MGVAPDRMSDNGSSYWSDIYGRQADKWWRCVYGIVEVCVGDGGGVCRGWRRCVYGIVEVCVGDGGGVWKGW